MLKSTFQLFQPVLLLSLGSLIFSSNSYAYQDTIGLSLTTSDITFENDDFNAWNPGYEDFSQSALGIHYFAPFDRSFCLNSSAYLGKHLVGAEINYSWANCTQQDGFTGNLGFGFYADSFNTHSISGFQLVAGLGYRTNDFGLELLFKFRGESSGLDEYIAETGLNVPAGFTPRYDSGALIFIFPF